MSQAVPQATVRAASRASSHAAPPLALTLGEPAGIGPDITLAADPRLPHANFLLATNAIYRNKLDEGVELLEKELAINPADSMALYRLGEAWSRRQAWDKAIPALQRSLWINPYYSGPYIVLGRAYLATGQLDTARGMLQRSVELDPNNKAARYLYGQALQRLGKSVEAKEQFDIHSKRYIKELRSQAMIEYR